MPRSDDQTMFIIFTAAALSGTSKNAATTGNAKAAQDALAIAQFTYEHVKQKFKVEEELSNHGKENKG